MDRTEKQYASLSVLAEDYRKLLSKEFKREFEKMDSRYLRLRRAEDPKCRTDAFQSGVRGVTDDEIKIMDLEQQIRRICAKLNESLPMPFLVLDEYVEECKRIATKQFERSMKRLHLVEPARSAVLKGLIDGWYMGGIPDDEHKHLIKAMLAKLHEN